MVAGRPAFRYQAIISVLTVFMIHALVTSLAGFWHLTMTGNQLMLWSAAAAGFAWLSWRYPVPATAAVLVGGIAFTALVLTGYLPQGDIWLQTIAAQASDFAQNLRESQLEASFGPALGALFVVATALGGALVIIPESLGKGNTFWAIALGTVVFGTEWAWFYDPASMQFALFAVLAFCIWILGKAAVRDARWFATKRKIGYPSHVVTPLAWVLIIGFVSLVLPSEFKPMDLGAWGEQAQEAFPVLKQLRGAGVGVGNGRFTLRSTGFSPTLGALGGPVKLDNTVVMRYAPDRAITETIYLRGATFQVYDGRSWEPGTADPVEVPKDNGSLPTSFGSDVLRNYVNAKVTAAVNLGGTIFNQWEPASVTGLKNGYRADSDGVLIAARTISKGGSYEILSRVPQYSAEQLRKITANEGSDSYQRYLQLPSTLPDRVQGLTEAITANAATPYDKAVAIESYLRSLEYDLNVDAAPQGRDFVDYFLNDLKRGYCVYSASAMTVMLREIHIPSRLIEGFALPASAQYTEDAGGKRIYAVLNSEAHAWVEAYFPGYGWVTFDPTPRSDLPVIDRSTPAPQANDATTGDNSAGQGSGSTDPNDPRQKLVPEDTGDLPTGGTGSAAADAVKRDWPWALIVLAAVGAALLTAWRRLQGQERIVAKESRQVVQEVWSKTGSLMDQFGAGPAPAQTALEYADALGRRWPSIKAEADEVAQEYTEARYAPPERAVNGEAPTHARAFWDQVRELLFAKFGWRTYFWRRLRWRATKSK
jgi:transglutaminase-like putative cysteine protease